MVKEARGVILLVLGLAVVAFSVACVIQQSFEHGSVLTPIERVRRSIYRVSQEIKPGIAPGQLSGEDILSFGYGSCGQYSSAAQSLLAAHGIKSEQVGLENEAGEVHGMLEVNIDGRWILTNPMYGLVYENSFEEIIRNPRLADQYWGSPIGGRGSYFDPAFFINPYNLGTFAGSFAENMTSLSEGFSIGEIKSDGQFVRVDMIGGPGINRDTKVEVKWEKGTRWPLILALKSSVLGAPVFYERQGQQKKASYIPGFEERYFLISEKEWKKGSVRFQVRTRSKWPFRVKITLFSSKHSPIFESSIRATQPSYLIFMGAAVDISEIAITCGGKPAVALDMGNLEQETRDYSFVFSEDERSLAEKGNGWGPISQDDSTSFRTAELYNSKYNQSSIQFRPLLQGIDEKTDCDLQIKARRPKYNDGSNQTRTTVKIFDTKEQSYKLMGELAPTSSWTSFAFPVRGRLLTQLR